MNNITPLCPTNGRITWKRHFRMTITDIIYFVAEYQGRLAYALMSVYASCVAKSPGKIHHDPRTIIFGNMVCGICIMIFGRPSMAILKLFYRIVFSIGGALMFNHASLIYFDWIQFMFPKSPFVAAALGYLGGRVFMVHYLAYLYHVDTRTTLLGYSRPKRDPRFEHMYILWWKVIWWFIGCDSLWEMNFGK